MPRKLLIVALALPLVVIALGIAKSEHHLATSKLWQFDVAGYDPRDLLRGRYIQFRLDLHEGPPREACNDDDSERCCLCLTETGVDQPPRVERATCALALAQCDGALQTRTLRDLNRYYIPEEDAWKLEQQFIEAAAKNQTRLRVAINDEGKPQIDALLINGEVIRAPFASP